MTSTARTYERPTEYLRLEWEAPDEADERAVATEAVAALFSFADSWLEPLAMQLRVSCYDREILTEGKLEPTNPFHLLVREPRPAEVRIDSTYHQTVEHSVLSLTQESAQSWVGQALAQLCGDATRFQTSFRELELRASRVLLPSGWSDNNELALECYAGTVRVPVDVRGDAAWVSAPPQRWLVYQPVEVKVENWDGMLRFVIDINWSPWVGEHARPGSPLADGIAQLAARGWSVASE